MVRETHRTSRKPVSFHVSFKVQTLFQGLELASMVRLHSTQLAQGALPPLDRTQMFSSVAKHFFGGDLKGKK